MTNKPTTLASVIGHMPFLRTNDAATNLSRGVQLAGHLATAHEAATRYRTAVLHHDDLAARLRALYNLSRPEVWNGYIPPRTDGYGEYNPSPYRAALIEIVTQALTRDGDWRHHDSDRLATVPTRHIRAPWAETRGAPNHQEAGLWRESEA